MSGCARLLAGYRTAADPEWEPGKALEYLVLRAFQLDGAEVKWPYIVREEQEEIEQIDGVVYWAGLACLIECKDTADKINIESIAKLRNQLLRRPGATIGVMFSRGGFTEAALALARYVVPQTILLWTDEDTAYALQRRAFCRALVTKFHYCVEYGQPFYDIRIEGLL